MAFCTKCGNKMDDNAAFCSRCGTRNDNSSSGGNNDVIFRSGVSKKTLKDMIIILIPVLCWLIILLMIEIIWVIMYNEEFWFSILYNKETPVFLRIWRVFWVAFPAPAVIINCIMYFQTKKNELVLYGDHLVIRKGTLLGTKEYIRNYQEIMGASCNFNDAYEILGLEVIITEKYSIKVSIEDSKTAAYIICNKIIENSRGIVKGEAYSLPFTAPFDEPSSSRFFNEKNTVKVIIDVMIAFILCTTLLSFVIKITFWMLGAIYVFSIIGIVFSMVFYISSLMGITYDKNKITLYTDYISFYEENNNEIKIPYSHITHIEKVKLIGGITYVKFSFSNKTTRYAFVQYPDNVVNIVNTKIYGVNYS